MKKGYHTEAQYSHFFYEFKTQLMYLFNLFGQSLKAQTTRPVTRFRLLLFLSHKAEKSCVTQSFLVVF